MQLIIVSNQIYIRGTSEWMLNAWHGSFLWSIYMLKYIASLHITAAWCIKPKAESAMGSKGSRKYSAPQALLWGGCPVWLHPSHRGCAKGSCPHVSYSSWVYAYNIIYNTSLFKEREDKYLPEQHIIIHVYIIYCTLYYWSQMNMYICLQSFLSSHIKSRYNGITFYCCYANGISTQ